MTMTLWSQNNKLGGLLGVLIFFILNRKANWLISHAHMGYGSLTANQNRVYINWIKRFYFVVVKHNNANYDIQRLALVYFFFYKFQHNHSKQSCIVYTGKSEAPCYKMNLFNIYNIITTCNSKTVHFFPSMHNNSLRKHRIWLQIDN